MRAKSTALALVRWVRQVDWIGWVSSAILVLTLGQQVLKQWRDGRSEGVSIWLFVGQMTASTGFLAYSVLVANWVFVVTNALLVANGATGYWITCWNRRRASHSPAIASLDRRGTELSGRGRGRSGRRRRTCVASVTSNRPR
jgi:uncharacterized protein with PQ loop repeat